MGDANDVGAAEGGGIEAKGVIRLTPGELALRAIAEISLSSIDLRKDAAARSRLTLNHAIARESRHVRSGGGVPLKWRGDGGGTLAPLPEDL